MSSHARISSHTTVLARDMLADTPTSTKDARGYMDLGESDSNDAISLMQHCLTLLHSCGSLLRCTRRLCLSI